MASVTELAEQLGKAIASSPQAANLHQARAELDAQPDVLKIMQDYHEQEEKIARLLQEKRPVEADDKRKAQELREKLIANPLFKKFTAAQVEYIDLMRNVNETIRRTLAATEQ